MKNKKIFFIVLFLMFIFPVDINAEELGYTKWALNVRSKANNMSDSTIIGEIPLHAKVSIESKVKSTVSGCPGEYWYYVKYSSSGRKGYVCGYSITLASTAKDASYEKRLKEAGFPSDYIPSLVAIHKKHPKWNFVPVQTNLDWNRVVDLESKVGVSLIEGDQGYRSTETGSYDYLKDKFKALDGSTWFAANRETVAYYLDPRNYLLENTLFMFESMTYNSSTQNVNVVKDLLSPTKLYKYDSKYYDHFIGAGDKHKISSTYLASRVRQEIGSSTAVISGAGFTYDGKSYKNLYNPYNIGATSGSDNWKKGLVWASAGKSYGRPWNTLEKAIYGGAEFLAKNYVNNNQYNAYLQRFNVFNGIDEVAVNQYMTNVGAPVGEGSNTYSSYNKNGILDKAITFSIPVYKNMPKDTYLPNTGNPNNYLKTLKVGGSNLTGFSGEKTSYTKYVSADTSSVNITATTVNGKAKISGTGTVKLSGTTTNKTITVTAQNGATKKYTVKIVKNASTTTDISSILNNAKIKHDSSYIKGINPNSQASSLINEISKVNAKAKTKVTNSSGKAKTNKLATGDKVTIEIDGNKKTYTVVIYGDTNGDGKISSADLLKAQKHILKLSTLSGAYKEASDSNKDSKISSADLLKTQKHILKIAYIKQ